MIIRKRKREISPSSICCSRKLAGRSISRGIGNTEVSGMPNEQEFCCKGYAGIPMCSGVMTESRSPWSRRSGRKRARCDRAAAGQSVVRDCLEARFGRRPVIFYNNGYEHWLWDDFSYPPRQVQGFYKKDELELLIQRRESRKKLRGTPQINPGIVERYYQTSREDPANRGSLRTGQRTQSVGGDGHRRRQDTDGDRAM